MKLNELIAEFGDYEIKDLDAVKAMLERPKPKTVHDLKVGDMYWVLVAQGEVSEKRFFDDGFDNGFIKQGKAFLTEEEGIKQAKHDEIEAELKRLAGGHKWTAFEKNWSLNAYYDFSSSRLMISITNNERLKSDAVYFASKEDAENAFKEIGEERLLRDYFNVEVEEEE